MSGFVQHPYILDSVSEPICVALAPWLDIALSSEMRIQSLLLPAIDQVLAGLTRARDLHLRVALALCLPAPRPGLSENLDAMLRERIRAQFPGRFSAIATFQTGHAAGLQALHAACGKLADGSLDACVVAGVESYMCADSLEWLEANDQLHGAGQLNNAWGFIPGEAASAVLVLHETAVRQLRANSLARILTVGRGFESNAIRTDTVCIGEGLTAAFRGALAGLPSGTKVTDVVCDMNGEPYRADEFGFACLRTKEFFESASDFVAPADCWGDVSAAFVPLALVLATAASAKAYSKGRHALVWASSENGDRGAALLEFTQKRSN